MGLIVCWSIIVSSLIMLSPSLVKDVIVVPSPMEDMVFAVIVAALAAAASTAKPSWEPSKPCSIAAESRFTSLLPSLLPFKSSLRTDCNNNTFSVSLSRDSISNVLFDLRGGSDRLKKSCALSEKDAASVITAATEVGEGIFVNEMLVRLPLSCSLDFS